MSNSVSKKLSDAGIAVVVAAKNASRNIAESAENAADFVKKETGVGTPSNVDVGTGGIRPTMDVIASCGTKVGVVDGLEDDAIKLTRNDSPDDQHHFVPLSWVAKVDRHVHLNQNSEVTQAGWKCTASACGCSSN